MSSSARRLILWDIDGTLTRSGTVATGLLKAGVETVLGEELTSTITFAGKTDRQITEEFLTLAGNSDPSIIERILDYVEATLATNRDLVSADAAILPGAVEAIEALSKIPDVSQTVLTGNLATNARSKLSAFGLCELLDFDAGAYGRDHIDRCSLLPVAWDNQQERYGLSFTADETWIVGDTPFDLACAHSGGTHCLLVGTGRFDVEDLQDIGADAVLPDLSDTAAVVAILTEGATT